MRSQVTGLLHYKITCKSRLTLSTTWLHFSHTGSNPHGTKNSVFPLEAFEYYSLYMYLTRIAFVMFEFGQLVENKIRGQVILLQNVYEGRSRFVLRVRFFQCFPVCFWFWGLLFSCGHIVGLWVLINFFVLAWLCTCFHSLMCVSVFVCVCRWWKLLLLLLAEKECNHSVWNSLCSLSILNHYTGWCKSECVSVCSCERKWKIC